MIRRVLGSMWWKVLTVHCMIIALWCGGVNLLASMALLMISSNVLVWVLAKQSKRNQPRIINFRG